MTKSCFQANAEEVSELENLRGQSSRYNIREHMVMKGQDPCLAPGPYQFGVHHWYRLPGSDANTKKALHGAAEVATMRNRNDVQDATLPLNDAEEEDEEKEDEEEEDEEPRYMQVAFKEPGTDVDGLGSSYRSPS